MSLLSEIDRLLRQGREQAKRTARAGDIATEVRRTYGRRVDAIAAEIDRAFARGVKEGFRQARMDSLGRTVSAPEGYSQQRALDLLTNMSTDQRRVLAAVDRYARRMGLPPARRLDLLRASGGFHWRQAEHLTKRHAAMLQAGVPHRQLRRNLVQLGDRWRMQRARMIARTEAAVAENVGKEQAWKLGQALGLIPRFAKRVWVTALDERTCPTCSALDGITIPIDSSWESSGRAIATPGAVHPHCRCSEELVMGSPIVRSAA
jgi:hypothetical protein